VRLKEGVVEMKTFKQILLNIFIIPIWLIGLVFLFPIIMIEMLLINTEYEGDLLDKYENFMFKTFKIKYND